MKIGFDNEKYLQMQSEHCLLYTSVGDYLGVWEYGLDYALTINRADGTVENYSKEMLGDYIASAWGREYPLVFYSEEEVHSAIAEYKGTLNITERCV